MQTVTMRSYEGAGAIRVMVILLVGTLYMVAFLGGCQRSEGTMQDGLKLFYQNELEQALPIFEQLAEEQPQSAELHCWLAETYRRLGRKQEAVAMAEKALTVDACNSFALVVIADAVNPLLGEWPMANADRTWHSLNEAIRCDSSDGMAWLGLWGEAVHRADVRTMRLAEEKLMENHFFTDALLAYSRWTLRGLPEKAIVITNGDMDTYPTYAVQKVEGMRPDVVIVNRGLLTTAWYARYLRDHEGLVIPMDDASLERFMPYQDDEGHLVTLSDEIFRRWIEESEKGELERPLTIAATVDAPYYAQERNHFVNAGAFLKWTTSTDGPADIGAMQKSVMGVRPEDFRGPWTSQQDRSPIRRLYTRDIVRNVTATALTIGESYLASKQMDRAREMADWAAELERVSNATPAFAERIAALRKAAGS